MMLNDTVQNGKRLSWPDMVRGLGVCLVIFGHLLYSSNMPLLNKVIYSFHVPMFFILSGFLYKHHENASWRIFLWNKAKRLLIPAILSVVLFSPLMLYHARSLSRTFANLLQYCLYISGTVGINAPAWFFFCLFEVFVLARLLSLDKKSVRIKLLITLLAFLGGWMISHLEHNWFGCKNMLPALGFFAIGSILKQPNLLQGLTSWSWLLCSFCLWSFLGWFLNGKVSMYDCYWGGDYFYFILSGITGAMFWIGIMHHFSNIPMLKTLSTNSVFIICTHYLFVIPYARLIRRFRIQETAWGNPLCIVYFSVVICMYWMVCWFLNRMQEMDKLRGTWEQFKQEHTFL